MSLIDLQVTLLDLILAVIIIVLAVSLSLHRRRLESLENRLEQIRLMTNRELKMVNQGAIGLGRRFAVLEKQLKSNRNPAKFTSKSNEQGNEKGKVQAFEAVMQNVKKLPKTEITVANIRQQRHSGLSSQSEKALTEWLKSNVTA